MLEILLNEVEVNMKARGRVNNNFLQEIKNYFNIKSADRWLDVVWTVYLIVAICQELEPTFPVEKMNIRRGISYQTHIT